MTKEKYVAGYSLLGAGSVQQATSNKQQVTSNQ